MQTTYLKDFIDYSKKGIVYFPIGTIEWHGNHLPVETDFMVAQRICELANEQVPGYVMPPFYMGTDRWREIDDKEFFGMDGWLGKKLAGNLYWLEPEKLESIITDIVDNLTAQGFKKIFIISGHGGSRHVEILEKVAVSKDAAYFINPFTALSDIHVHHADEYETSVFWACYPGEEAISRAMNIPKDDDYVNFKGYDPRDKSSLETGERLLSQMVSGCLEQIKENL